IRRPAALRSIRALQRLLQPVAERLEIDHARQPLQRIADLRQCRIAVLQIEEPWLNMLARHSLPPSAARMERIKSPLIRLGISRSPTDIAGMVVAQENIPFLPRLFEPADLAGATVHDPCLLSDSPKRI